MSIYFYIYGVYEYIFLYIYGVYQWAKTPAGPPKHVRNTDQTHLEHINNTLATH